MLMVWKVAGSFSDLAKVVEISSNQLDTRSSPVIPAGSTADYPSKLPSTKCLPAVAGFG